MKRRFGAIILTALAVPLALPVAAFADECWHDNAFGRYNVDGAYYEKYEDIPCDSSYTWEYFCTDCGDVLERWGDYVYHHTEVTYEYDGIESAYDDIPCEAEYIQREKCTNGDYEETYTNTKDHEYNDYHYVLDGKEYSYDEFWNDMDNNGLSVYDKLGEDEIYEYVSTCDRCGNVNVSKEHKSHDCSEYGYCYNGKIYESRYEIPCGEEYEYGSYCPVCEEFYAYYTEIKDHWYDAEEHYYVDDKEVSYDKIPCDTEYKEVRKCICGELNDTYYSTKGHNIINEQYVYNGKTYTYSEFFYSSYWDEEKEEYVKNVPVYDSLKCEEKYIRKGECAECGVKLEEEDVKEHRTETAYIVGDKEYNYFDFDKNGEYENDYSKCIYKSLKCGTKYIVADKCTECEKIVNKYGYYYKAHNYVDTYVVDGKEVKIEDLACGTEYYEGRKCADCGYVSNNTSGWNRVGHTEEYAYMVDGKTYSDAEFEKLSKTLPCDKEIIFITKCKKCDEILDTNKFYSVHSYKLVDYQIGDKHYTEDEFEKILAGLKCNDEYFLNEKCEKCGEVESRDCYKPHNTSRVYYYNGKTYSTDEDIEAKVKCGDTYYVLDVCDSCDYVKLDYSSTKDHSFDWDSENIIYVCNGKEYSHNDFWNYINSQPCSTEFTEKVKCRYCDERHEWGPYKQGHSYSYGDTVFVYNGKEYDSNTFEGITYWSDDWNDNIREGGMLDSLPCESVYTEVHGKCIKCGEEITEEKTIDHDMESFYEVNGKDYDYREFNSLREAGKFPCGTEYKYGDKCSKCDYENVSWTSTIDHKTYYEYACNGKKYSASEWSEAREKLPCETDYAELNNCKYCDYSYNYIRSTSHKLETSYVYNKKEYTFDVFREQILPTLKCDESYITVNKCKDCDYINAWPNGTSHNHVKTYIVNGKEYSYDEFYGTWKKDANGNIIHTCIRDTLKCKDSYTIKNKCEKCGDVYEETYSDGHNYSESYYTINDDKKLYDEYYQAYEAAKCKDKIYCIYECSECGEFHSKYEYTTKDHEEGDGVIIYNGKECKYDDIPCGAVYRKEYTCELCKHKRHWDDKKDHDYVSYYYYVVNNKKYSVDEWVGGKVYNPDKLTVESHEGVRFTTKCNETVYQKRDCANCGVVEVYKYFEDHTYDDFYEYNGKKYTDTEFYGETHYDPVVKEMVTTKGVNIPCGAVYSRVRECSKCNKRVSYEYNMEHHTNDWNEKIYVYNGKEYSHADFFYGEESVYGVIPCGSKYTEKFFCEGCKKNVTVEITKTHDTFDTSDIIVVCNGKEYKYAEFFGGFVYDTEGNRTYYAPIIDKLGVGIQYQLKSKCNYCDEYIGDLYTHYTAKGSHDYEAKTVTENKVEATYEKEGSYDEVVYCSECGEEISRVKKVIAKLEKPEVTVKNPFVDMKDNAWYAENVLYVYKRGAMTGLDSTHFGPNDKLTRSMTVTILWKVEGSVKNEKTVFPDVKASSWYGSAVAWAKTNNIVGGYTAGDKAGMFGPKDNITRQDFIKILYSYAQFKGYDTKVKSSTSYLAQKDASSVSKYARESVNWGFENGFIGKDTDVLNPKNDITRKEAAAMIARFLQKYDA